VDYEFIGPTTMGNDYATVLISSPDNLENIDRLIEINQQLSDPRNTTPEEARALAAEGVPFHHLEAAIHSSEVGNGQAINDIVHRLATEDSAFTEKVLNNSVIVLVPSKNPDGQPGAVDIVTSGTVAGVVLRHRGLRGDRPAGGRRRELPYSDILASGYLRGEDRIAGAANVVSFDVGGGEAVVYGSEVAFRT